MTAAERQNLINSLIIDNNTNQVTPAKVREVMHALNEAIIIAEPSGVSALAPLVFNSFANEFSIQVATDLQDGYLTKEDHILFKQSGTVPQADKKTIKHKGWFNGVKNTSTSIELGDICEGWNVDHTEYIEAMRYVTLGDDQDENNYEILSSYGVSLIP